MYTDLALGSGRALAQRNNYNSKGVFRPLVVVESKRDSKCPPDYCDLAYICIHLRFLFFAFSAIFTDRHRLGDVCCGYLVFSVFLLCLCVPGRRS
jgi:hypothetical protein